MNKYISVSQYTEFRRIPLLIYIFFMTDTAKWPKLPVKKIYIRFFENNSCLSFYGIDNTVTLSAIVKLLQ